MWKVHVLWQHCVMIYSLRKSSLQNHLLCLNVFPPTESSTKFHCLRVYFQTKTWMGMDSDVDPLNWGWRLEDNQLIPIMSDMNAAPDTPVKMVHCNCTTGCNTPRCSCKRYGLPCTSACGSCQLASCDNSHNQLSEELENSFED